MKRQLSNRFPLSNKAIQEGILTLESLLEYIQQLPYGRNKNRADLHLVLDEKKGTCSSKHACIKKIAEENNWEDIELLIGIYKMNQVNTPKIGTTLLDNGFDFIPEAHCYLKIGEKRIDITNPTSSFENVQNDIFQEHTIEAEQVNTFKVELHQNFLKNWIVENEVTTSFEELWKIRELCIARLSE